MKNLGSCILFLVALLATNASARADPSACVNSGKVTFFNVKGGKGFLIHALYGKDSFSSYFHGDKFIKGVSPERKQDVYFKIDDVVYEHLAVSQSKYAEGKILSSDEMNLNAHFIWERSYLQKQDKRLGLGLKNVENFGIVESVDGDKKRRLFHIWSAELDTGKRYVISTSTSFGVVVLVALGVEKVQDENVKLVIDNYMYKYRQLNEEECQKMVDASFSVPR